MPTFRYQTVGSTNGANGAGVPIVSASVAPTLPPTVEVLVAGATQ